MDFIHPKDRATSSNQQALAVLMQASVLQGVQESGTLPIQLHRVDNCQIEEARELCSKEEQLASTWV